jgi:dTDP-glucose pyrophosphorylase
MNTAIGSLRVSPNATLHDVMKCIDRGAKGIALVVKNENRLVGTVTDGDIRRALLSGAKLDSGIEPYMRRHVTTAGPDEGRAEILDLMQARSLRHIPVIDRSGRLVGLHLLHELVGNVERPNWAVIMAGGKGTRLRPITEQIPKPMIRVAGRPILERLLLHLVGFGFKRIFLSVNYLSHMIEDHFGDGARFGCQIEYLRETEPLGTAGALSLLPAAPHHPVLVLNGDLVTQVNVDRFLAFHGQGQFSASVVVRRYAHQVPFGCIETQGGRVSRLEEKPVLEQSINAGVYLLSPETVENVATRFYSMTDLLVDCLARKESVGAFEMDDDWIDIGEHEQLRYAQVGAV